MFGGNGIISNDIESGLFGTSLGVNLQSGEQVEGGHRNHLRAINTIRAIGSVEKAIESGLLKEGITYEVHKRGLKMVLGGSIRGDGPLPGLLNDMRAAPNALRQALPRVEICVDV